MAPISIEELPSNGPVAKRRKIEELEESLSRMVVSDAHGEKLRNELPDSSTLGSMPQDEMRKTYNLLQKGKFVALTYMYHLTRAYSILKTRDPNVFKEKEKASLAWLQNFTAKLRKSPRYSQMDKDSKTAFAFHIEVCKSAMPEIFSHSQKEEKIPKATTKDPVKTLFHKAPTVPIYKVYQLSTNRKIDLEKKHLLKEELQGLLYQVENSNQRVCQKLMDVIDSDAKRSWRFIQDNAQTILNFFPRFGMGQLVILSACRDIIKNVLEKHMLCQENWRECRKHTDPGSRSSFQVTALLCGPIVKAEKYEQNLGELEWDVFLDDCIPQIKPLNKFISEDSKRRFPPEYQESYQYLFCDLPRLLRRYDPDPKPFTPEEKLYIRYHLNLIQPYIIKMNKLTQATRFLQGDWEV